MIKFDIDTVKVLDAVTDLIKRIDDPSPAWQDIGEYLIESTKRRFAAGVGPDGMRWAPNTRTTIEQFLQQKSGVYDKATGQRTGNKKGYYRADGRLGAKGAAVVMGKKPLIGESHRLSSEIHARPSRTGVEVGSVMEYAAVQQFGAKQHSFTGGRTPWGDIPARPFLGLSDDDENAVLDILRRHIARAAGG